MRRYLLAGLVSWAVIGTFLAGCTPPQGGGTVVQFDPVAASKTAKKAGYVAVLGWVAGAKPDVAKVGDLKKVVLMLKTSMRTFPKAGFYSLRPELIASVDKVLPGDANKAARLIGYKVVEELTTQLDNLFGQHPEWKDQGDAVSSLLLAFLDGANDGLSDYLANP